MVFYDKKLIFNKKMARKEKILKTALEHSYIALPVENGIYRYKWLECPDESYIFESIKPYDHLDMGNAILSYKIKHRLYK